MVSRRRASWQVAVAAAVVLIACGGGAAEPTISASAEATAGLAPTVDRLAGVWLDTEELLYVVFTEEGRVAADPERGYLYHTPYFEGTYEIDGNTITFTTVRTEICTKGDTSAWTASVPEPSKLEVEVIDDGAGLCAWGLGEHELLRVGDS